MTQEHDPKVEYVGFSCYDGNVYNDYAADGQVVLHILRLAYNQRALPLFWGQYPL